MKVKSAFILVSVVFLSTLSIVGCGRDVTPQIELDVLGPALEREALENLLPKFSKAWNTGNADELMKLCHPDSKYSKAEFQWAKLAETFGEIGKTSIRKYIAEKGRFVVRVAYAERGVVPGTFMIKQVADGSWLILDFNIDGQGESELGD